VHGNRGCANYARLNRKIVNTNYRICRQLIDLILINYKVDAPTGIIGTLTQSHSQVTTHYFIIIFIL